MSIYDLGYAAGKSDIPHDKNPFDSHRDNDNYECWLRGWRYGRYAAAEARSLVDDEIIVCPQCTSEGARRLLPGGEQIWDPGGAISSGGGYPELHPDLEGYESLYCDGCEDFFYRTLRYRRYF